MDAFAAVPRPYNEPVREYAPGSADRARIEGELRAQSGQQVGIDHFIAGRPRPGAGAEFGIVAPHRHSLVLGTARHATAAEGAAAVNAALDAAPEWANMPFEARAAVFLKAAELASGPWRARLLAATMLGQSKSVYQGEIDAPCEMVDFWRYNVAFAREILAQQPESTAGVWNRIDHRPLEGFVYAITPFNFTAIAANLPTAPALMGNTVVWKPSPTQTLSAYWTMELLTAAGLPPGVINLVTGDGLDLQGSVLAHPALAGVHFTGSTGTFQHLWRTIGNNIDHYRGYPRLVGETGGKDFILAHSSADPDVLTTAMIRGAFDYQGQKCSAASRAYIPASLWRSMGDDFLAQVGELSYGDVADLGNFGGALIDARSFAKFGAAVDSARFRPGVTIPVGGRGDDSEGYFAEPTVLLIEDPGDQAFSEEYFAPLLSVHVYDDSRRDSFADLLTIVDATAPYALTGSIIATDRAVIEQAGAALRYTAGNFYINDKPSGAVVGQQPFGGARASGTDDKAGSPLNLLRWVSPRSIKETFVPPTNYRYPHMG